LVKIGQRFHIGLYRIIEPLLTPRKIVRLLAT
jgi:hypothetical protein